MRAGWAEPRTERSANLCVVSTVSTLPGGQKCTRTDELGHFVARYSDDGGKSWSDHGRHEVPYRLTPLDVNNDGEIARSEFREDRQEGVG